MRFPFALSSPWCLRRFGWHFILAGICWVGVVAAGEVGRKPLGMGDPGTLVELVIETGRGTPRLVGRDARQQLVVSGVYSSGQTRDVTAEVQYQVSPAGVVSVDASGYVVPQGDGTATVTAATSGGGGTSAKTAQIEITVERFSEPIPVHFANQVVPIFTKYGCNGGGCHGKSGGQNGFRLSLLGFVPSDDYEWLVKEGRGRRLFPAAPDRSLLLQKAAAIVPHGGGQRLEPDSPAYDLLRRWIAQGMPEGDPQAARVVRIEVTPRERLMEKGARQQLAVIAHFSDGSTQDVTRMTQFVANDTEMASTTETGLLTTGSLTGSVAVMARYQGHVAVFRATIPLGVETTGLPSTDNVIDREVFGKLQQLGLPPSPVCDDATFLRRVTIDIAGRLPTAEEARAFLASRDPQKRAGWIDRLLDSEDYADYFATKWAAILRNKRNRNEDRYQTFAFHHWIRSAMQENLPYDRFVRAILTATGTVRTNPAVAWYRQVRDPYAQLEDTAQLFLGLRIGCARCHHHPFEVWSQEDYYGFAAFFSRVGRKPGRRSNEERIFHNRGVASARNPKTGRDVRPTGLGGKPLDIAPHEDPRVALADWISAPDNPFFARALVNRYWKHFFGRGLVDPEDDMRVTNPASHPELLDELARGFIQSGFDLKGLIRTICNSQVYQLSAEPNEWNIDDRQNYSRFYPKRLNAEVLLDAIDVVTGSPTRFGQVPSGMRATQLPDSGFNSYFLTVFGRPQAASACECERSSEANLAQSLHLLNSREIQAKLASGRAAKLAAAKSTPQDNIREIYLTAFSREPTEKELAVALAYLESKQDAKQAYEDILWAVINTKEFLFNH